MITTSESNLNHLIYQLEWQLEAGALATVEENSCNRIMVEKTNPIIPEMPQTPIHKSIQSDKKQIIEKLIECKSLKELKQLLSDIETFTLNKTATNLVFSDGNPESKIVFVNGVPDSNEDRMGNPLVGEVGILFDKMLNA